MKRTGMILMAALMAASVSMAALASEDKTKIQEVGMDIALPEELEKTKGAVLPYPVGAIDTDHQVYAMGFIYEALPREEAVQKLYGMVEMTEEEMQEVYDAQGVVSLVVATGIGLEDAEELCDSVFGVPFNYEEAQEIGSAGSYTFYVIPAADDGFLSSIGEEYAEEYRNLQQSLLEAAKGADLYEPVDEIKKMAGGKLSFTTTDLEGNTITSEEIFSGNEITMLNCWGVWCPNCVNEMAELAEIHSRMQEKGCGIVGLEWEKKPDEETYQEAGKLMEESGTNYPNYLMPEELQGKVSGFPTSIFVDREGNILGIPIEGAAVSLYESRLEELLGEKTESQAKVESVEEAVVSYTVCVSDGDGPVEGAAVQFCNDTTCRFDETDEEGKAVFAVPAGVVYEVHVMEVPDGYKENEEIYRTEEGSSEVSIVLEKDE